ncbi:MULTISPECIES: hypothetical protein [Trichocoleus]|uniref:Uncharacterized protein n=1 Tax=Trichocoleus desertorum GB2-A4 TaxID=2933944 RepID=A0ABV0JFM5_9CYAN|nr:hypothetical protein [Trichocoleus sp. FACHB-46]
MSRFLTLARSLLAPLLPQPNSNPPTPTIESYGQGESGIPMEEMQPIMEWLFASLFNAGYYGTAHIVWYNDAAPDPKLEKAVKDGVKRDEPTLLYRCGSQVQPPPNGYYWRLMAEHPSNRIYQLEVKEED